MVLLEERVPEDEVLVPTVCRDAFARNCEVTPKCSMSWLRRERGRSGL
jgi:hypothetical protein